MLDKDIDVWAVHKNGGRYKGRVLCTDRNSSKNLTWVVMADRYAGDDVLYYVDPDTGKSYGADGSEDVVFENNRTDKSEPAEMREVIHYLTDCTLATVEKMAMMSQPPNGEFKRQISIAQDGVNFIMNRHNSEGRVQDVISDYNGSVAEWAEAQKL